MTADDLLIVQARLDAATPNVMAETEPLEEEDLLLVGRLIQTYCFSDLNARRIIDCVRHAALGAEARNASRLPDAQVFPALREAASLLWKSDRQDGIIRAANTIELHRIHRHNFAHWALRRVRGERVLIMMTKNAREAERRDGIAQQPEEMKYGLVPLDGLLIELSKLDAHGQYLAVVAADVETNLDRIREQISRQHHSAEGRN